MSRLTLGGISKDPITVTNVIRVCERLRPDTVITSAELAARMDRSKDRVFFISRHPKLAPYRVLHKNRLYWGNRETIAKAKRRFR